MNEDYAGLVVLGWILLVIVGGLVLGALVAVALPFCERPMDALTGPLAADIARLARAVDARLRKTTRTATSSSEPEKEI
jgi:hypothetical protein